MSRDDKDPAAKEPVSEGDREDAARDSASDVSGQDALAPNASDSGPSAPGTIVPDTSVPDTSDPDAYDPDAAERNADALEALEREATEAVSNGDSAASAEYEPDGSDSGVAASESAGDSASPSPDATETAVVSAPPRDLAEAVDRASKEAEEAAEGGRPMTLLDHLSELRVRLVRCLIALAVGFFACYGFAEQLFNYLMIPLTRALPAGGKLIYTALPEAFFVYMQVALVAGAFLASPYLFYQIWSFIAPGLYDDEKRHIIPIAGASALFFVAGAAFCYFQVFPYAFEFFVGFATDIIEPMPKLDEYLGFTLKMLLAFGLIFEMPLFAFFLARLGLVTAQWMRKTRKYAILAIFIVAAILTPPDVFSQLMMAAPMLVLYEISILVAAVFGKKKPGEEEDGESEEGGHDKPTPDTIVQGD